MKQPLEASEAVSSARALELKRYGQRDERLKRFKEKAWRFRAFERTSKAF